MTKQIPTFSFPLTVFEFPDYPGFSEKLATLITV